MKAICMESKEKYKIVLIYHEIQSPRPRPHLSLATDSVILQLHSDATCKLLQLITAKLCDF